MITKLDIDLRRSPPSRKHKDYINTWNRVVKVLNGKDRMECDLCLESLRDAAHRGLLMSKNVEACQGVLDCTGEYERTGQVPKAR